MPGTRNISLNRRPPTSSRLSQRIDALKKSQNPITRITTKKSGKNPKRKSYSFRKRSIPLSRKSLSPRQYTPEYSASPVYNGVLASPNAVNLDNFLNNSPNYSPDVHTYRSANLHSSPNIDNMPYKPIRKPKREIEL